MTDVKELVVSARQWQEKIEENAKLKELLKECKYELRGCYTDVGREDQSLINKIDNVLGNYK